jgi:hypothetical protein
MRSLGRAVALALVATVALVGCSVPSPYGLRLNSDGTVDAAECYGLPSKFTVDYVTSDELDDQDSWVEEWILFLGASASHDEAEVVRYGEVPDGSVTTELRDPPSDWVFVSTSVGSAARDELVEGEWVWWYTSRYPWEPEHPCGGLGAEDLDN